MSEAARPLVTVAIPLYHSARFLDVVSQNIRSADYPNLEILIGDRHLADDTVEELRSRFAGDTRLRFITARDEVGWVDHYNLLLAEGRGEYFLWMPHDDSYPAGYIGALVDRLEAAPGSILVFGYRATDRADGKPNSKWSEPPFSQSAPWTVQTALRMFFGWDIGVAMRGAFRRSTVLKAELWLPHTTGDAYADVLWLFAVALLGRFEFVPETHCLKRFYPGSTHTHWGAPKAGELPRRMGKYLAAYVSSVRQRRTANACLWVCALVNRLVFTLNQLARREVVSEQALRGMFAKVLR